MLLKEGVQIRPEFPPFYKLSAKHSCYNISSLSQKCFMQKETVLVGMVEIMETNLSFKV